MITMSNTVRRFELLKELLMPGAMPIILPTGYVVKFNGYYYEGEGGWFFAPHGVENNKFHWKEIKEETKEEDKIDFAIRILEDVKEMCAESCPHEHHSLEIKLKELKQSKSSSLPEKETRPSELEKEVRYVRPPKTSEMDVARQSHGFRPLEGTSMAMEYGDYEEESECDNGWPFCDVAGCGRCSCRGGGVWAETGYWSVCSKHSQDYIDGKPRPIMKSNSVKREASRRKDGTLKPPKPQPSNTNKERIEVDTSHLKLYTEKELLDAERAAFNAAKDSFRGEVTYQTFDDYRPKNQKP